MKTHYLIVAFRNLLKYKTQNFISIVGLAVGLFCFCICFYISRFVGSIDTCFENHERIADIYLTDEGGERWSGVSGKLLPHLQQRTWDGVEGFTLLSYPEKSEYNLIGEGTAPIGDFMQALSSVNYNGFISLEKRARMSAPSYSDEEDDQW